MPARLRKLVGTVILLIFVPFYALIAMTAAVALLPGTSGWVQAAYYVIAGLIWVVPAGFIITWMVRPAP